jgi:hypothetical protein
MPVKAASMIANQNPPNNSPELPAYVPLDGDWGRACDTWLAQQEDLFARDNSNKLRSVMGDLETGARMVVNIGSYAMLRLLQPGGEYRNVYDLVRVGARGEVPGERARVDALIAPAGVEGSDLYFGAVGLETAGVRFYGEYCLVLAPVPDDMQIFERDSYELVFPPLKSSAQPEELARALRGRWQKDLVPMAVLKTRELIEPAGRLVTEGRFREALLRGEEFIEVHREGPFRIGDVEKVYQSPSDIATESRIERAYSSGVLPHLEELVWQSRRARIEVKLSRLGVPTRVVGQEGVR